MLTCHARFMDSLQWVDQTYYQKHKSEDPKKLRATYHAELKMYSAQGDTSKHKAPMDAAFAFLIRFSRRAGISLAIYALSYLPVVGRFVLPAASFYTFNNAVGPIPATIIFGSGIFLPRRYLIVFLQSYFSSRSLMRELVSSKEFQAKLLTTETTDIADSSNPIFLEYASLRNKKGIGSTTARVSCSDSLLASGSSSGSLF